MYLGVDLGGINIASGIVDDNGNIIKKISTPTPKTPEEVADVIASQVISLLDETKETVSYVGIGSPGTISPRSGKIIYWSNLNFNQVYLGDMVANRCGLRVLMENDAGCAALGEYIAGAGKNASSLIVITLGTGIGGGAVINGKLYTGLNHAGLEVGHMVVEHNGKLCNCKRRGCFEMYCSATALINDAKDEMNSNKDSILWTKCKNDTSLLNGKIIFDAYELGDMVATNVVSKFLEYLSNGVVSLVNIFQPEVFCIGGGLMGAGDLILNPLKETLDKEDYARNNKQRTTLVKAKLGNDAGIIGAAMLEKFQVK